jgi:hypothetical protein
MSILTTLDAAHAAVRERGGYIVCCGHEGYWYCPSEGDVIDLLVGTADATREDLTRLLRDFELQFIDLDIEEDAPVLYAANVADFLGR